jgi:hypothetical protein
MLLGKKQEVKPFRAKLNHTPILSLLYNSIAGWNGKKEK